jgi:hypothetical protein
MSRYGIDPDDRTHPNGRVSWINELQLTIAGSINKDLDGDLPLGGAYKTYLAVSLANEKIYNALGELVVDSQGNPVTRLSDARIRLGAMIDLNRLFNPSQAEQRNPQGKIVVPANKASVDNRAVFKALIGFEHAFRFGERNGIIPIDLTLGLGAGLGNDRVPSSFIADLMFGTSFNWTRGGK